MSDLDVIKEIENIIGRKLKSCRPDADFMNWENRYSYILNHCQQVIGLNLQNFSAIKFKNIAALKSLTNLKYLNLSNNLITDISAISELVNQWC